MNDSGIRECLLDWDISFEQAIDSDVGGDSGAEDDLPILPKTSTPIKSRSAELLQTVSLDFGDAQGKEDPFVPVQRRPNVTENQIDSNENIPLPALPSTSKGISTRKRGHCRTIVAPQESSDSDVALDSDEDPEFILNPSQALRKKRQKRFPLIYDTSSENNDSSSVDDTENVKFIDNDLQQSSNPNKPTLPNVPIAKTSRKPNYSKVNTNNRTKASKHPKGPRVNLYKWDKTDKNPKKFSSYKYDRKFGLNVNIKSQEPGEAFKLIFDDDVRRHIVEQSNLFAVQNNTTLDLTVPELDAFLGILIFMGFHQLPSMKMYWSDDENYHVERIARVMTLKRFLKILRYLHLNDNSKMLTTDNPNFDKLYKVRPLIDILKRKYLVLFSPSRNLAVDESMVAFKGRTTLKQYVPKKPVKRGFKIWVCACSETGFVLTFDVYTGKKKDGSPEIGLGERVVLDLTTPFLGIGHCIYFDNFFSSVGLAKKLLDEDTFCCGTILQNRVEYPSSDIKPDKEISLHDHDFAQSGDISVVKWADRGKKCVSVLSTMSNPAKTVKVMRSNGKGGREEVTCPEAVAEYNKYMGGVDRFDQYMSSYNLSQKSRRWWMKLFYFLFESAIVNSYILYSKDRKDAAAKPMSHLTFRSKLVNNLIGTFTSRKKVGYTPGKSKARKRNSPFGTPTIENSVRLTNVGDHLPKKVDKYRRCAHCSTKAKEKRSNMVCSSCDVALCKGCFLLFHQKT